MKIEKIIIRNIASIEGEQTIDFTQEPLRSAALFAITGNTGAGKSTILDAICLCLYNRAPRLEGVEQIHNEDLQQATEKAQQVQAKSTATLLRRGKKEGGAEIVFTTLAGERYEATWSVRVKRTGTYDSPERTLRCTAPNKLRYDRSEIQTTIENAIGLSYEQFTRTVILAQNSFANFLRAKANEKAVLLEKLTGTEIYGSISKNIYTLTSEAETKVRDLQNQMEGMLHDKLSDQELSETNEQRSLLQATLTESSQREKLLVKQLDWIKEYEDVKKQVTNCETSLQQASKLLLEARSDELDLIRYDELLPFRPIYQEITMRYAEIEKAKNEEGCNEKNIAKAQHSLKEATNNLNNLHEQTVEAEQQRTQRIPTITRGHNLTGEILVATQQLTRLEAQLKQYEQILTKRREVLRSKQEIQRQIVTNIEQHKLHKQALSVHNVMFEKFDLIKDKLSLLNTEGQRNAECHNKQQKLQQKQQEIEKQGEKAQAEQHNNQARLNALKSELLVHRQANQGRDSNQLQQAAAQESARLAALQRAAVLWQHITEGYKAISDTEAELRREQSELSQFSLNKQKIEEEVTIAYEAYQHISTAYTLSQSQNIVRLRQQLKEGTACPVCGATHHPYHTETERELGELLSNLKKEYAQQQQNLNNKQKNFSEIKEHIAALQARIEVTRHTLKESKQRQLSYEEEWKMYVYLDNSFAECSPSTNREARRMMIQLLIDNTTKYATQATLELENFNFHQQHINRLNEEIDKLDTIMVNNRTFLDKLHTEAHIAAASAADLQQTINLSDRSFTEIYTDLDEMITVSGWFREWQDNSDSLRLRLTNLHTDWLSTCTKLDHAERQAELLNEEIKSAEANCNDGTQMLTQAREARNAVKESLIEKKNELQRLFPNTSPQEEAELIEEKVRQARLSEQDALHKMQQTQAILHQLEGQRNNLKQNLNQNKQQLQEKQQELDLRILKFNASHSPLQLSELKLFFSDTRDWNYLRHHIDKLKEQKLLAQTQLENARQKLLTLQAMPFSPNDESENGKKLLQEELLDCRKNILSTQEQLGIVNSKILAHNNCIQRAAKMQHKLDDAQNDANEWNRLNTLFGSADGQKFRKLAQSYTFSTLVSYANHHLHQLSPRYELHNLQGTLMLEIIDHDMFDEHRYVPSLSGGETFVVSLALALGLASLSGNGLAIGSLFIDEGFGNLDSDSLDLVMQALANLENQQGRKVGVISHTEQIRTQISPQILVKRKNCGGSIITIK